VELNFPGLIAFLVKRFGLDGQKLLIQSPCPEGALEPYKLESNTSKSENLSLTSENKGCHAEFSSASRFSLICEILKSKILNQVQDLVQDDRSVKFQIFLFRFLQCKV
jgi:hypothetical protein